MQHPFLLGELARLHYNDRLVDAGRSRTAREAVGSTYFRWATRSRLRAGQQKRVAVSRPVDTTVS